MSNLTTRQIKAAVLRGLAEVATWFDHGGQATDGSVRAALAIQLREDVRRHAASGISRSHRRKLRNPVRR